MKNPLNNVKNLSPEFQRLIGKKVIITGDTAHVFKGESKYLGKHGAIIGWIPNARKREIRGMIPIIKLENGESVCSSELMWTGEDEISTR